jgi:crotonobetainyl-CoA:carnitine CoA-transferase CaiB-like acyl-CoA transferase
MEPLAALTSLWNGLDMPAAALAHVRLTGADPVLPSSFAVGTCAQASIAAAALAAAELWRLRTGRTQTVSVDMRHAAVEFRSERYLRVEGRPGPEIWDKIAGAYRCGDGRWVRLHTNFPHHRAGVLAILGCAYDRAAVQAALDGWKAEAFEDAAAERGLVVAAMRTQAEWDAHPHGQAVGTVPVVVLERIGAAPPEPFRPLAAAGSGGRPLSGVRVLDLTRVIAGPVCGRTLAAHGADVLAVTAPHLPSVEQLVIDNGRGKLSTHLDLRQLAARATLEGLLREADVFVQGYRPGGVGQLGFSPETAARLRPGIVYVSLSAYGHVGPWAARRGFDSLVQTASGFNAAEAQAAGSGEPRVLPCQALDHAAGFLMAFGAMAALHRRATQGGSWHVRVSLVRTGHWLRSLGRVEGGQACADPRFEDVQAVLDTVDSGFGQLVTVRHSARMSETAPRWTRPSVPLGTHPPKWPD